MVYPKLGTLTLLISQGHSYKVSPCFVIQTLGENAPSQLILYHYPDLKEEKGVVLMTAEMDPKFIVSLAILIRQQFCVFGHLDIIQYAKTLSSFVNIVLLVESLVKADIAADQGGFRSADMILTLKPEQFMAMG